MKTIDLMSHRELRRALREALVLLAIAKCPNCDGSGSIGVQVRPGMDCDAWEQEQCQWCHEKKALAEDT